MLLWMVGRRIGSAIIRSRKTNRLRTCVFLETIFAITGKLSRRRSSSNWETCWGQWYLLESRKKSENSCSCKSATRLVRFAGTNVLKMSGHGFGWGNRRGLVGCDWISHHIPIAFNYPERLHAIGVSTNTVLIQSLMHLSHPEWDVNHNCAMNAISRLLKVMLVNLYCGFQFRSNAYWRSSQVAGGAYKSMSSSGRGLEGT